MTSNGNTAQKHLIKILTETHPDPATAYRQAEETAPNKETAETIKRTYKKLKADEKLLEIIKEGQEDTQTRLKSQQIYRMILIMREFLGV